MYFTNRTIVFLNGEFIPANDARVSMFNQTLHYGNGVIEGIRAYSNPTGKTKIFKAKEHYKRLKNSCEKMYINLDYSVNDLVSITKKLLQKNNLSDAYIRPLVFTGTNMSLLASEEANIFIAAWKWARYFGDKLLSVTVSPYERPNPNSSPADAKITGHYTNSILATTEARRRGFDEALLLDMNGHVAEGPGCNVFFEKNKMLYTPAKGNILPGITRSTVIHIAKDVGIPVKEKLFTMDEMLDADSAFFTGTAAEIAGIESIDGHPMKLDWEDSLGYILSNKYKQLIKTGDYHHSTII